MPLMMLWVVAHTAKWVSICIWVVMHCWSALVLVLLEHICLPGLGGGAALAWAKPSVSINWFIDNRVDVAQVSCLR